MKKTDVQFSDVKEILDGALLRGGADVEFPTNGKAVHFRQRCYSFRKWKRETLGEHSPYERLVIQEPENGKVKIRGRELAAKVTYLNEAPLDGPVVEDDGLEDMVKKVAARIKGSIDL